jgi:hypothetical protein
MVKSESHAVEAREVPGRFRGTTVRMWPNGMRHQPSTPARRSVGRRAWP